MRYHPYVKYVSVSPDVVDLFENLSSWLEEDDNYFETKYFFLQYLLCTSPNFSSFVQPISKPEPKEPKKPRGAVKKPHEFRADIAGFPLTFSAIQYCIDSCPHIFDKPSLIYFLNAIGARAQNQPLRSNFYQHVNFNFRLRSVNAVYSGRSRDFSVIDKFLSKRPNFRQHLIELFSRGNFDASMQMQE